MIHSGRSAFIKFAIFATVMMLLTTLLFLTFAQHRTGSANAYSAVFADSSRLKTGDSVRVAGIRVGTVGDVELRPDTTVLVKFDADRTTVLTAGTKAAVRYLNLVGDRYLELVDGAGANTIQPAGSQIPIDRTMPALDLDLLLGGLKPVIRGLKPQDVNALTNALIQIFQGQGPTLESLLTKTSGFATALADNRQTLEAVIDNLNTVMATISQDGTKFSDGIDKLENLISGLSEDRDPIGTAIDSLNSGTAALTDLLSSTRRPLAGTVDQLSRLAPILDHDKDVLDAQLGKLPENYRKLARLGAYGSFFQFYLCGLTFRATDLEGRTAVFPWFKQEAGRCSEP